MAREYARLRTSILADTTWRKLSSNAQNLYYTLLVHPTMSYAGVVDWRPKRLAASVLDWTVEDVEAAAQELEALEYVVTDDETEEILVRSFIRNDNVLSMPQLATALVSSYAGIGSLRIRLQVIYELKRLGEKRDELKGWAKVECLLSEPCRSAFTKAGIQGEGQGAIQGGGQGESEVGQGAIQGVPPIPTPIPNPSPNGEKKIAPANRKTKAPESMPVTDGMRAWAKENGVFVNLETETSQFLDHHASKGTTFVDWNRAWQTWMRRSKDWAKVPEPDRPTTGAGSVVPIGYAWANR